MIKVGLMGFGRTGKSVAAVLLNNKDVHLAWVVRKSRTLEHRSVPEFLGIDSDEPGLIYSKDEWNADELLLKTPVDVIIDFSSAEGIDYYGEAAKKNGVRVVTAISAYPMEKIEYVEHLSKYIPIMWSPNITIGVNFLIVAAQILKKIAPYTDIAIVEEHFKAKKEVSGTAKIIARSMDIAENEINSIRVGGIVGSHKVIFGFPYQTVRIEHEAVSREAFGNGALFATKNIMSQDKGLYSMEDFLLPYFLNFSK